MARAARAMAELEWNCFKTFFNALLFVPARGRRDNDELLAMHAGRNVKSGDHPSFFAAEMGLFALMKQQVKDADLLDVKDGSMWTGTM
jgi:hypothetical protein